MSATQDTLFSSYAAEGDITRLFRVTQTDEENLFSSIDLPSLTKQITSLPVELVPRQQEIPESTLFGTFSSDGVHQPPLSPVSSILSLQEEATQHTLPDDDDVWQHADELPPPTKKVDTWETFGAGRRSGIVVEVNPFVTEQRPTVFDELLRRHINHIYAPNESGIVADEHLFRECLLAVSTGRESSLFQWKEKIGVFEPVIPRLRVLAISPAASESIMTEMCRRGTVFRRIADVTENILRSPGKHGSIAVSFARAIISITQHWQSNISYSASSQGILSLQSQFRDIDESLFELAKLCSCNSRVQSSKQVSLPVVGGELLTQLYITALTYDYPTSSHLRALSICLLTHTSTVFLDLLTYWIGYPSQPRGFSDIKEWYNMDTSGEFFIQRLPAGDIATCKSMNEFNSFFQFDAKCVPGFIDGTIAREVFEMGWGLRLLWRCLPNHPLCDIFNPTVGKAGYELRWLLSWEEIFGNHERLDKYATDMAQATEQFERDHNRSLVTTSITAEHESETAESGLFETKEAAEQMLSTTIHQMSLTPTPSSPDPLMTAFTTLHLSLSTTTLPLLSLISQNSFTHALTLQHNLIQTSLHSLFFTHHNLPSHLSTLHSYLLFGNGVFITKLNEALFDDFDDDDVRSGGLHGLGLGVGLVEQWPPSAGKVTSVLRGVLADLGAEDGGVSFAYRELDDQQFEKFKNPVGLEALDFLQLQYKPPFPLDAVITSEILHKYDRIFLHLLRCLRMQYVSGQLFRDASSRTSFRQGHNPLNQRFRIEAHHFITAICGYIFNVCISTNWHSFETSLSNLPSTTSISQLRNLHSSTLDKILYSCLLKKRQQPILTLLYATFEPVLLFAKISRMYATREQRVWHRMREEMEDNTTILYAQFVKRAGMFVRVVEGLERKGMARGEGAEGVEGGWFRNLLVRLDGSYFDR